MRDDVFDLRGHHNAAAMAAQPDVRARERDLLIEYLMPRVGQRILDVPSGTGYMADELARRGCEVACVDWSRVLVSFAKHPKLCAGHDALPFPDGTFDGVVVLAGIHHLSSDAKQAFIEECYRVLLPGGRLALAEVLDDTPPARFLNEAVDRWSTTGHKGAFVRRGELAMRLRDTGFRDVNSSYRGYLWTADSGADLIDFCQSLFGMVKASPADVRRELVRHLGFVELAGRVGLPWSLMFAAGDKPERG